MTIRTAGGGFVSVSTELHGVSAEVRRDILAREAADKERRKAYRKKPKPRIGSAGDTFKEWDGRFGAILPSSH